MIRKLNFQVYMQEASIRTLLSPEFVMGLKLSICDQLLVFRPLIKIYFFFSLSEGMGFSVTRAFVPVEFLLFIILFSCLTPFI